MSVVLAVAALAFVVRFEQPRRHATGDTYWYALQAQQFAGIPEPEAKHAAAAVVCDDLRYHISVIGRSVGGSCAVYRVNASPRYTAIFGSRPLWPLLVSPAVGLLGLARGLIFMCAAAALLAALAVFGAVRGLGGSRLAACAAGISFSVLPTGYWSSELLPEGAVLATLVVALWGAARVARGRWSGLAMLVPGLVALYAFKPANGAALACGMLAAGLVLLPWAKGRLHALALVGVGAAGVLGWIAVSRLLHLPSLEETLQDLATRHFTHHDVANPYGVLRDGNYRLWTAQVGRWLFLPWPFGIVLPAGVISALALRRAGLVVAVGALAGVSIVVGHPMIDQYDRLVVSVWLVVVVAVAVLVDLGVRHVTVS